MQLQFIKNIKKIIYLSFFFISIISCGNEKTENNSYTPKSMITIDGKALYEFSCASCHSNGIGPNLKGTLNRIPNKQWLYDWVQNPTKMVSDNDKYAVEIYEKWNKSQMTAFPKLSNEEIDAIIEYIER